MLIKIVESVRIKIAIPTAASTTKQCGILYDFRQFALIMEVLIKNGGIYHLFKKLRTKGHVTSMYIKFL